MRRGNVDGQAVVTYCGNVETCPIVLGETRISGHRGEWQRPTAVSSVSGLSLGEGKLTDSPDHQWINEAGDDRVHKPVATWPGAQPGNVGR